MMLYIGFSGILYPKMLDLSPKPLNQPKSSPECTRPTEGSSICVNFQPQKKANKTLQADFAPTATATNLQSKPAKPR